MALLAERLGIETSSIRGVSGHGSPAIRQAFFSENRADTAKRRGSVKKD